MKPVNDRELRALAWIAAAAMDLVDSDSTSLHHDCTISKCAKVYALREAWTAALEHTDGAIRTALTADREEVPISDAMAFTRRVLGEFLEEDAE